ncbi:ribosomal protein L1 [Histomonas meleagridis]|uniref:ribosomal protein L1 n=1 Tax=Histomonas meleagridis TaxID=135588 RepID=UPI003559B813|nr:ribosomal protein L1 [Histomonas meleagridis]KAH0804232.1 ribosomal protein L1 [Histomonas meleagridis]
MCALYEQIHKGFSALQTLERKDEEELIPEDPNVTLIFQLWEPLNYTSPFPITIEIPHSLHINSLLPVRVITKDPQEEWKEKFKEALPPFPLKVYSITKWKKRFNSAYERRNVIKETSVFVADRRIGYILGDSIGADFFAKKKLPVLVDFPDGEDVLKPIQQVLECTTATLPKGYKFASAVGRLSWNADDVADNSVAVIDAIFEKIGKEKVAAIFLRTPGSTLIPVYTADIKEIITSE